MTELKVVKGNRRAKVFDMYERATTRDKMRLIDGKEKKTRRSKDVASPLPTGTDDSQNAT